MALNPNDQHREPERWQGRDIASPVGVDDPAPAHIKSPNYALWLFYLYFRPVKFFREFVIEHLWITTILCAWLFGISRTIERAEMNMLKGKVHPFGNAWGPYLAFTCGVGLFVALLYFALGGWWYRVRLIWSGARDPDRVLARRVYVYAATIAALPTVATTLWEAGNYPTPMDAYNASGSWWYIALMVFPFWSAVVSHIGVRTVFGVRGFKAALWFLILPGLVYLFAFGAVILATGLMQSAPSVSTPHRYSGSSFSLTLPGDWDVDTTHPAYDPDYYIPITMPQDGFMQVYFAEDGETPKMAVGSTITSIRAIDSKLKLGAEFAQWGTFQGHGRELTYTDEGDIVLMRIFATRLPDNRVLVANEICDPEVHDEIKAGYEQVAQSLSVTPLSKEE